MICPFCARDMRTYAELAAGGVEVHCGECHAVIPPADVAPTPTPGPGATQAPTARVVATQASCIAKIVADAKARLVEIEARIADVEAMLNEASALRAMISAAEGKPHAASRAA